MRKKQKEQIEGFIKLLRQAHEEVKQSIKKKNSFNVLELLRECQNGAIVLGNIIEKAEGEGFKAISILEEYCELIYELYIRIVNRELEDINEGYEMLSKSLREIENSIYSDIKLKTVAVFLPYKASMWDSLESVWKAADEDPACDVYVVPIPYYDKNPDGSFREEHYEGNEYPDLVPITKYDEFNFEEIHPDVIFIHNPYDEYNYVTSVHPFFYTTNLKKFTDNLVYIPYFTLKEIDPYDQEAIEKMEHFCMVPGVFNADKVIVQSENMRQVYINVLTKEAGRGSRTLWEKIIMGLGSPKFDKVEKKQKKDIETPEEWLDILGKSHKSMKKIILYNTGTTAILKYGDKILEKIKQVLQIFRENKNETVLWWRPHPLMKATIKSMRPQLWEAYDRIVKQYCEEGWGIYDDSADLSRAIALSDAYYGDSSSVVQLFQKAGKPVMIQNVEVGEHSYDGIYYCTGGGERDKAGIFNKK